MFRMWCKLFTDNHLVKDITIEDIREVNFYCINTYKQDLSDFFVALSLTDQSDNF